MGCFRAGIHLEQETGNIMTLTLAQRLSRSIKTGPNPKWPMTNRTGLEKIIKLTTKS